MEVEVLCQKRMCLRPAAGWDTGARTELSAYDGLIVSTAMGRAWGYQGGRIIPSALEAALTATVEDLPFLAGR